ncbi:MAG: PstS family phosphate ABC transporter substrate-binding protein [Myxococcota bacterium]
MQSRMLQATWLLVVMTACRPTGQQGAPAQQVRADGSSTVFPITEAMAEEFRAQRPDVQVTAAVSGTGGGFKRLCAGEADLVGASRPIKGAELEACAKSGVTFVELPVAYDGLAVVVNPRNTWAQAITVEELRKIWQPESQGRVMTWKDVRADWPDTPLRLFGPGVDSGTYDYFTEAIIHREHASRGDFTSSEDDNILVQGVSRDEGALGFFGYGYYAENQDKLRLLPVDDGNEANGAGAVAPSPETVRNGSYQPLSRPLFVYVSARALERPEVLSFISFYLQQAPKLVGQVGYVPLQERGYQLAQRRLEARTPGSLFGGKGAQVGVTVESLLEKAGPGL